MAERKVNFPVGFSNRLAEAVCTRCLYYHECRPRFDVVDDRVTVAGSHANVNGECLFASKDSRGPVIGFKNLGGSGDLIAEDLGKVLKEIDKKIGFDERLAIAVLTCFHCPLVSECKPDYVSGQLANGRNMYVIVKGGKVQCSGCRLTNVK